VSRKPALAAAAAAAAKSRHSSRCSTSCRCSSLRHNTQGQSWPTRF
jgi:hypothetical protein